MRIIEYLQFTKKQRGEFKLFDETFPYKLAQGVLTLPKDDKIPECNLITIRCSPSDEEKFREDTKEIEQHGYTMIRAIKMDDGLITLMFEGEGIMPQRSRAVLKIVHLWLQLVENWPRFWRISWSGKCSCCNEEM